MPPRRRLTIGFLAGAMLLAVFLLASLNAFNFPFLNPAGISQIFLFTALSVLVFLLLVVLLVLLSRNILKLYAGRPRGVLGSRIRTRMLAGALILSFAPALFMFLFSYGLMNRSIDRWFSQPVAQLRDASTSVALELWQYAANNAQAEAQSIATSASVSRGLARHNLRAVMAAMRNRRITLQGGFAVLYRDGQPIADYQVPSPGKGFHLEPWTGPPDTDGADRATSLPAFLLQASYRSDHPAVRIGAGEYVLGAAATPEGDVVVVGLPMPQSLTRTVGTIRDSARDYWALFRARNNIRGTYLLLMLLLTVLTLFASSWLALLLARQVTEPVETLSGAMDRIAAGQYSHRVALGTTEEMRNLIQSFNAMAADLEESRGRAETAAAQLSEANRAIEERRRELETILDTIPNGVVTLDAHLRIQQANPAVLELMNSHPEDGQLAAGLPADLLFPGELMEEVRQLIRRSQRMGVAAGELEFTGRQGPLHLAATVALLEPAGERRGYVLVLEDVTELWRAQRQAAWKEVAQRVAHEIKNPLTPILLSAERIRKHVDRPGDDSAGIIRRCSEVILGAVETMRRLVDQFGALAQFPASSPRPVCLNGIVQAALLPFAGRLEGISVKARLAPELPAVLADPESLKRALVNLIDNAAEAMQGSLHRHLTLSTGWNEAHNMAEICVADTGRGLTSEMRERLFVPYFSTKSRGTGLGLAIAAQIVQEHGGSIRAEGNVPAGARFILDIPFAEGTDGTVDTGDQNAAAASVMENTGR